MGNDVIKPKSPKTHKPVNAETAEAIWKALDNTKRALILYKPWCERATEIMEYFYDALSQLKPAGLVEFSTKNAIDLSKHDDEYVRNRTSKWLMSVNNIVLLCIAADQAQHFPREAFTDESGKLPDKLFPLVFGNEIPSLWPECYSLGIADPDKIERPNDFESDGLEALGAAIRGMAAV